MSYPNRFILFWLLLLLLFIFQSSVLQWFFPGSWTGRVAPHLLLICIVYASLFVHRYLGLGLGLFFGLLHDLLFYGSMLGLYTFAMGLTVYLAGITFKRKHMPYFYVALVVGLCCLFFDSLVFFIYRLFEVVSVTYSWALFQYILPSLLLNLFLFTLLYIPLRYYVETMIPVVSEEDT